jgi:hypothetical protein
MDVMAVIMHGRDILFFRNTPAKLREDPRSSRLEAAIPKAIS